MDDDFDILVSDIQTKNVDKLLLFTTDNLLQFTTDEDMMLVKEAYLDLVSWLEQEQE